jgi:predicted dehydrogenase
MKRVVLEGGNGEWAQECYLPFLLREAAKGDLELRVVDVAPQIKLDSPALVSLWRGAKASYLDKTSDEKAYVASEKADYVFIVTPDRYHCEVAAFWRERLNQGGHIFIEKPLDASSDNARALLAGGVKSISGYDHYLAKVYPFLRQRRDYLGENARISRLEFNLLEAAAIAPNRAATLDRGVILDLLGHILAVVGTILGRNSASLDSILKTVKLGNVAAARYRGSPIAGETYARISFSIGGTEVIARIGKGVGKRDDKCLIIHHEGGKMRLNFKANRVTADAARHNSRLEDEPVASFLKAVLSGEEPLAAPGVLSFTAALAILETLEAARNRVGAMPLYAIGTPPSRIAGP